MHHSDALDLIRLISPDLLPRSQYRLQFNGVAALLSAYAGMWVAYGIYGEAYWGTPLTTAIVIATSAVGAAVVDPPRRWFVARRRRALVNALSDPHSPIQGAIVESLRQRIALERDVALGPGSELDDARRSLKEAQHEAARSVLYWLERSQQEPDNLLAAANLETAQSLRSRFSTAASELDKRVDALRGFLDRCEAKVATLQIGANDIDQSRRLAALAEQADSLVAETARSVSAIGQQFIVKAVSVAQAIGTMERTWLKHAAGELPLDQLDRVADEIIHRAEDQERELKQLASSVQD